VRYANIWLLLLTSLRSATPSWWHVNELCPDDSLRG